MKSIDDFDATAETTITIHTKPYTNIFRNFTEVSNHLTFTEEPYVSSGG